jgi:hypothetical protein
MAALLVRLMRRCVCWSALSTFLGHIAPASAANVRLLSSVEMDFPEGKQSVEIELRASGYEVLVEKTEALEPGRLLEELGAATQEEVVASVAVVRLGRGGIAYVWLSEAQQMYRVTSSETDTARAANVLSLRVVELISLRGSGFEIEQSAPAPRAERDTETSAPDRRALPPAPPLPWMAWLALGPEGGSGLMSPLTSVRLGLTRKTGPIALEASGHFSPTPASQRYERGDVRISSQGFSLGAFLQNAGTLRFQFGPTAGVRCLGMQSVPSDGSAAFSERLCSPNVGVSGRVGTEWQNFSLWISGSGSLNTRRVDLLADEAVLATLGRPDAWIGVMMGFGF